MRSPYPVDWISSNFWIKIVTQDFFEIILERFLTKKVRFKGQLKAKNAKIPSKGKVAYH